MGRRAVLWWHAALFVAGGVLYFFFVLPRWPELIGDTSHGLGTAARIIAGLLVGLAALPVVFSLVQLRKPEFGTPALALTLRTWSVVAHVTAGVLIVGTAISEIWLSLDSVGQWLFGIYGAAAAVALLGIAGFYLSFVAEQAPPPPKPLRPKRERRQRRRRGKQDDAAESPTDDAETDDTGTDDAETDDTEADDAETDDESPTAEPSTEATPVADEATVTADAAPEADETKAAETDAADAETDAEETGGLRNRRPSGKVSHRRRRTRRSIAVDE